MQNTSLAAAVHDLIRSIDPEFEAATSAEPYKMSVAGADITVSFEVLTPREVELLLPPNVQDEIVNRVVASALVATKKYLDGLWAASPAKMQSIRTDFDLSKFVVRDDGIYFAKSGKLTEKAIVLRLSVSCNIDGAMCTFE